MRNFKQVFSRKWICILSILMIALLMSACGGTGSKQAKSENKTGSKEAVESTNDAINTGSFSEIPAFKSVDLEGNEVDESIFSKADVTVVNIWGTFCGPCINEMPELAKWNKEMPDNVQIIGILIDVASTDAPEYETARDLVKQTGVEYTNIIACDELYDLLQNVVGVPTTLFVDSTGKCINEEVIGADVSAYKTIVDNLN